MAAATVAAFATGPVDIEPGGPVITAQVAGREGLTTDLIQALSAAGVRVTSTTVRRPSLDDVFLTLTGHGAGSGGPAPEIVPAAHAGGSAS